MITVSACIEVPDIDTAMYTAPLWSNGTLQVEVKVHYIPGIPSTVEIGHNTMFIHDQDGGDVNNVDEWEIDSKIRTRIESMAIEYADKQIQKVAGQLRGS